MEFDVTNISFWVKEENPWQIIFDGYKKGIKPGKQVRPYKSHGGGAGGGGLRPSFIDMACIPSIFIKTPQYF